MCKQYFNGLNIYNYIKYTVSNMCTFLYCPSSISSFLHRPGQVQYLPVHSIATDPHLYGKGRLSQTHSNT